MGDSMGKNIVLGFIAAALAVLTAHQAVVFALANIGMLPPTIQAWSTKPFGPFGIPTIANSVFWGGLWGALFGVLHPKIPGGALWIKGLIYGLFITVVSNWTLLPLIRKALGVTNAAQIALFSGGDPKRMLAVVLILGGFGIATGIFYGLLRGNRA